MNTWPASFIPVNGKRKTGSTFDRLLKVPTCSSHVRENVNMKKLSQLFQCVLLEKVEINFDFKRQDLCLQVVI